ncbi:hypothetical protein SZN_12808, partial [Streptomyces zinciresistens K42]
MRPDDRRDRRYAGHREGQGGVPDGLLVAALGFLLGMTTLVWTATGLAGVFARGAWPTGVTFTRTLLALRSLVARPRDIPGAWPGTPDGQLPGYGLFWGLFIGQLMVLVVLTVFVLGTFTRWRAVRAARRGGKTGPGDEPWTGLPARAAAPAPEPRTGPAPATGPDRSAAPRPPTAPARRDERISSSAPTDVTSATRAEDRT